KNKFKIGYVPQNIILFDDSIAANIAIGMAWEDINEKRLKEVINMSGLADYVYNLPNQEKTIVGENGARLSGGQKQRIGIARALYIEPEILIMDEATSSLDENTEKIIMDALISLKGSLTILSVTHRLSTLKYYDQILELHDGNFNMK
ncbi:ATP-binding cassette domain-containing protein, partial [Phascolarctobacterium sp.]